jgi:hypothetical protein
LDEANSQVPTYNHIYSSKMPSLDGKDKDATRTDAMGRQGRSKSMKDGNRSRSNRSRSPSAYLRKKGKSMKGLFGGSDKKSKGPSTPSRKDSKKMIVSIFSDDKKPATIKDKVTNTSASEKPKTAEAKPATDNADNTNNKAKTTIPEDIPEDDAAVPAVSNESPTKKYQEFNKTIDAPETPLSPGRDNMVTVMSPYSPTPSLLVAVPSLEAEETVQIILLLMDLNSRRFELLQLEFDPNQAVVNDILAQIPDAATEHVLRTQPYEGICSVDGTEMPSDVRLDSCVTRENEVKLAIPSGITGRECAKLAYPILNDKKVRIMVRKTQARNFIEECMHQSEHVFKFFVCCISIFHLSDLDYCYSLL